MDRPELPPRQPVLALYIWETGARFDDQCNNIQKYPDALVPNREAAANGTLASILSLLLAQNKSVEGEFRAMKYSKVTQTPSKMNGKLALPGVGETAPGWASGEVS